MASGGGYSAPRLPAGEGTRPDVASAFDRCRRPPRRASPCWSAPASARTPNRQRSSPPPGPAPGGAARPLPPSPRDPVDLGREAAYGWLAQNAGTIRLRPTRSGRPGIMATTPGPRPARQAATRGANGGDGVLASSEGLPTSSGPISRPLLQAQPLERLRRVARRAADGRRTSTPTRSPAGVSASPSSSPRRAPPTVFAIPSTRRKRLTPRPT